MFKLMKWFIKTVIFIILLIVGLIVAGNYQVIHSPSGYHVLKRDQWGFSDFYLDTTQWGPLDYAKYPKISAKLLKDKFQAVFEDTQSHLKDWWKDVSKDSSIPALEDIKREFDRAVEKLNSALKDKEISVDKYRDQLKALKDKTERKVQEVLKALKED